MKERLKILRENRQLTQRDFGIKIGVSDKVVSKWERGVSEPDIGKLKKISETFGVGIEELIGSPRLENVAFPTRKLEKGYLFYTIFIAATLIFIAAAIVFCVLYASALKGEFELSRPVGDSATCFIVVFFGIINVCAVAAVSQIKFKAFPMIPDRYAQGKTLNEALLMPRSIRNVYSVYGKWIAFFYGFLQLWNTLNITAYIVRINAILRGALLGIFLLGAALTVIVAGVSLNRIAERDRAAYTLFDKHKS